MFFHRKETTQEVRPDSPEVLKAKEYLESTRPKLIGKDSPIANLCGNYPFTYVGCSQNGEYTRYHFCEGTNKKIIYVVLSDEEKEKIIQLFSEKMKKLIKNDNETFTYTDSLKGMFVDEEINHRFYSIHHKTFVFMSDFGNIWFPT